MKGTKIPVTTIDTGVPVPERVNYPIRELKVGESFVFPLEKRKIVQSRASVIKTDTGREFTVKKMNDETARIWRTK